MLKATDLMSKATNLMLKATNLMSKYDKNNNKLPLGNFFFDKLP